MAENITKELTNKLLEDEQYLERTENVKIIPGVKKELREKLQELQWGTSLIYINRRTKFLELQEKNKENRLKVARIMEANEMAIPDLAYNIKRIIKTNLTQKRLILGWLKTINKEIENWENIIESKDLNDLEKQIEETKNEINEIVEKYDLL